MPGEDHPALIGGRYRVLRLLGKGGMGAVYEVEHTRTGQHLALKLLTQHSGASAERFKREARATSGIQSDHIVRVTDADVAAELGGAPFLVMELLEGADLARVTSDRPSAPTDVVEWLRQVARGLDKAHARGVVHRDLKPENLFLTQREDGSPLVKILDFGIAKVAAESTLTQSDAFLGTPGFMAPEQTDSRGSPVTLRADLYALGLIAFKLLTGHSYWKTGSLAQIVAQILIEPMPPPSERGSMLGPAFDAWFSRACDRDASKRFASAGEQVEALAVALGLPAPTRPSTAVSQPTALVNPPSTTVGEAPTFDPASSDVKTSRKDAARRSIARTALGAAAVVGVGVAVLGGMRREANVRALARDAQLAVPDASLAAAPSYPLPPTSKPPANVAIDAGWPPSPSSAGASASAASAPFDVHAPPATRPVASAAPPRAVPSAITPRRAPDKPTTSAPSPDTVWKER
jgi:eukaryotic-like serine/threonine-protein kinase